MLISKNWCIRFVIKYHTYETEARENTAVVSIRTVSITNIEVMVLNQNNEITKYNSPWYLSGYTTTRWWPFEVTDIDYDFIKD